MSELMALAERALTLAPAGDVLVTVKHERSLLLRFARSRPTQATDVDDLGVEFAVVRAGHVGRAETNSLDDGALADCARAAAASAEAAAAAATAPGPHPGFQAPSPPRPPPTGEQRSEAVDPRPGGDAVAAAFAACAGRGAEAHGVWTVAALDTALASSSGVALHDSLSDAFMKVTAMASDGRSGYAASTARSHEELDPAAIAERAAAKLTDVEPARLDPGEYTVVLEPHAVGDLLSWLGTTAFDGLAHAEGRGALSGRLGDRVTAASINLADSPRYPRTLPSRFDAEGVAKAPLPLIEDGVAHSVVHDLRSASVAGTHSTGHALVAGGDASGPRPTNLVLSGGGATDELDLCRPVERGVYVTRLWYTNPVRPNEALITGVTRDGTFLIEDGEITRPLADMRFTDSVLSILDCCEDLGRSAVLTSEGEFYGRRHATGVVCPPLRSSAMRFTA
jgi:PmbA protein